MKYLALILILLPTYASAGVWDSITDAVTGHTTDIIERFSHEDEYIKGNIRSTGSFRDNDPGRDLAHWANGTVSVITMDGENYIQLHGDFSTGPAPDLYLYTARTRVGDEVDFWNGSNVTEVSKLKSGSGAQYYAVDHKFTEVIIWCKRFGQFMGAATVR